MINSKYGKILYTVTSILVVLTGIAFIACCLHLFFTGGSTPFSRERVGNYLLIMLVPSLATLVLVISGMVYASLNGDKTDLTVKRSQSEILSGYAKRVNLDDLGDETRAAVLKERDFRFNLAWIASDISFLFVIFTVLYFDMCTSFSIENLNGDVIFALAGVLPLLLAAILVHMPKGYLYEKSSERELATLKAAVADGAPIAKVTTLGESDCERKTVFAGRIVIATVAVIFIILGIFNGGMADVLAKAIKICTECIGLG